MLDKGAHEFWLRWKVKYFGEECSRKIRHIMRVLEKCEK